MNNAGNPLDTPFESSIQPNVNKKQSNHPLSADGRFTRLSFLAWNLILGISFTCIFFILFFIGLSGVALSGSLETQDPTGLFSHPLTIVALLLSFIAYIAFIASFIIIFIRRLHDLNKTGWFVLLIFIPIVGIIFSIYALVARGSTTANNYGPFRPTEQAEKFLGYLYLIFAGIFLVSYLSMASIILSKPELFQQIPNMIDAEVGQMSEAEGSEDEDYSLPTPTENRNSNPEVQNPVSIEPEITPTPQVSISEEQTNQTTTNNPTQSVEVPSEQTQQTVDDAVRQAQEAAEAAVNSSSSQ